jgi:hypothetical protein
MFRVEDKTELYMDIGRERKSIRTLSEPIAIRGTV